MDCGCFGTYDQLRLVSNYTNHAPIIRALTAKFGFNLVVAGLFTTAIFLTHGEIQIADGSVSDQFGPRRLLLIALAIVSIGNFGLPSPMRPERPRHTGHRR